MLFCGLKRMHSAFMKRGVCVCVCGLGGVRMTLGRNVEGDCGVQLDLQISGLGKQVACRAVNW